MKGLQGDMNVGYFESIVNKLRREVAQKFEALSPVLLDWTEQDDR